MSKLRGEGPSPPFSIAPQVLPWGSLCDCACLRSSLSWGILPVFWLGLGPSRVKWRGQRLCPCWEDMFCLLSGLWPQSFFTQPYPWGGYSFWNQAGQFPTRHLSVLFVCFFIQFEAPFVLVFVALPVLASLFPDALMPFPLFMSSCQPEELIITLHFVTEFIAGRK